MSTYKILGSAVDSMPVVATAVACGAQFDVDDFPVKSSTGASTVILRTVQGDIMSAHAAAQYLARTFDEVALYGSNLEEFAEVDKWVEFAFNEVQVGCCDDRCCAHSPHRTAERRLRLWTGSPVQGCYGSYTFEHWRALFKVSAGRKLTTCPAYFACMR